MRFAGLAAAWRRLLYALAAACLGIAAAALLLPPPDDLRVDVARDMPFYSLPFGANPFAPAELRTPDGTLVNWRSVPSSRSCGECHLREFMEWNASMHAISDRDIIYDSTVLENTTASRAAAHHGTEKGRWCEGCHNPLGVLTGFVSPVTSVQETEALEEGVSCVVCHTATHAVPLAGNGAFTSHLNGLFRHLHPAVIMAAPSRHARDMQARRDVPLMGSSDLCGACHTEIRPTAVAGEEPMNFQDTYDEWRRSPWAQAGVQCQDCHMAREPAAYIAALRRGERPARQVSHRMPGNNYLLSNPALGGLTTLLRGGSPTGVNRLFDRRTWEAELGTTHRQVTELLRAAAELRVAAERDDAGQLIVEATVRNAGAGHALPTGPLDQRYMWLEVEVADAAGRTRFHRGAFDEKTGVTDPQATAWVKLLTDAAGELDLRHILFDSDRLAYPRKPIAAGAEDRVAYTVPLPADAAGPWQVRVRLWYRLAFQEILQNIDRQGLGNTAGVIIPPLLMQEATATVPSARVRAAAPSGQEETS